MVIRPRRRGLLLSRGWLAAGRDALWEQLTAKHDNYAGYQTKTDRTIPVAVLEPLPS